MKQISTIGIIGMGALGLLYADQLTKGLADMKAVAFVMTSDRIKRHNQDVYRINGEEKHFQIIDAAKAEPVDLLMVAVKYPSLPEALDTMANLVGQDTIIMSVMNGVTSEKIIAERYGREHLIFTVAQGMDAMRDGSELKYTQCGKLYIGSGQPGEKSDEPDEKVGLVEELFQRAGVPYVREADIMHRMWFKYMLNVGFNQACMVFDATYGKATTPGEETYEKMVGAMREVIPFAAMHGITLTEKDIQTCIAIEKTLDPDGYPSMAQDRKASRKSEVDMFAGEIIRMSEKYGVPVPFNRYLYARVKEIEAAY